MSSTGQDLKQGLGFPLLTRSFLPPFFVFSDEISPSRFSLFPALENSRLKIIKKKKAGGRAAYRSPPPGGDIY